MASGGATGGVQTSGGGGGGVRGKLLLLYQQRLVQLTLVLLDLLLHVGDCTCNLGDGRGGFTKDVLSSEGWDDKGIQNEIEEKERQSMRFGKRSRQGEGSTKAPLLSTGCFLAETMAKKGEQKGESLSAAC